MPTFSHVKIGPQFFKKELNDYSDWKWALVREAAQNGMDARGSNELRLEISKTANGDTLFVFANNGSPMNEEILINKLLALGESGKNFEGSVGGFGKAKVVLYMSHQSYRVRTGTLEVNGSGGEYELHSDLPNLHGTRSEVVIAGDIANELLEKAKRFIAFAQWTGDIFLNGERYKANLRKGSPRRDLGFATVYTNKVYTNRIIVRIDGVPMFSRYLSFDRCVVVELKGNSLATLTSNRDGLQEAYADVLATFIAELTVDKRSALRNRKSRYTRYVGERLVVHKQQDIREVLGIVEELAAGEHIVSGDDDLHEQTEAEDAPTIAATAPVRPAGRGVQVAAREEVRQVKVSSEFILKNNSEMKIPDYYRPENFSEYSRRLLKFWTLSVLEAHKVLGMSADFAVGFIFDPDCEAEHEQGDYGRVYYLNPSVIVEQKNSKSRSFRKRFKLTERHRLISIAVHEVTHGQGYGPHDEAYAGAFTGNMAVVMKNLKEFNKCFK